MSRVAIVRCEDYEMANVRRSLDDALERIPEADDVFAPGKRVLLKPNLLSSTHAIDDAVNTHPSVMRALAEYAIDRGAEVLMGDSCGCLSLDSTARAIEISGLDEIARDTGARVVNFDREPWVEARPEGARVLGSFHVPRIVTEVDALVTVPKFKTHGLTMLTGAIKNLLGLVPGKGKKAAHVMAPKPAVMALALVDILAACPPRLAVMDAVVGMEGEGPAAGRPRHVGCLLASADAVALDAIVAAMMGLDPSRVPFIADAARRGFGVADLDSIEAVGVPWREVRPENWRIPGGGPVRKLLWKLLPSRFVAWAFEQVGTAHATVNAELCKECGLCVMNCPAGALVAAPEGIEASPEKCIACYCCAEVCPHNAIEMRMGPLAETLKRLSRIARLRKPTPRGS